MVRAAALRRPTWTNTGSRMIWCAKPRISSGIVAENSSVWRSFGQRIDDAADVGPEAHVEHAVGFVEDEHLEPVEDRRAGAHVIHQPAGRRHDDRDAGRERARLRLHRRAAVHGHAADAAW